MMKQASIASIPDNVAVEFDENELERYSRQIRIKGFGKEGQSKMKNASALISRVGGVGGTIAMNLARAGIGRLVLAHGGRIVPEYLNRMQLAFSNDVGRPCTEVFVDTLKKINPNLVIEILPENVSEENIKELVSTVDIIADGAPLFEERYLMNDEAVAQKKPLVTAAMYSTEGYLTTIVPGQTPCLKCIYPQKPDYWTNIKVFPAIGPGPVIIGTMAAMEAIKILTGFGDTLKNKLWFFNIETNHFRNFSIERNPECPVCRSLYN